MYRLLSAIVCIFATIATWAQGYTINPDSTVTFSIYAPKADSVAVAGSIASRAITMTKDASGNWHGTSAKLDADLHYYWFEVDGVMTLDPKNPYVVRDTASLLNIFILPGEQSNLYTINDVPHGSVETLWYPSPKLGVKRRMLVYTPPNYRSDSEQRYPVLYLLHGMGGDELAWEELGRTSAILDNMIASNACEPMIVVMPNGNIKELAAPGQTAEGFYITNGKRSCGENNLYESTFDDIVSYVDSNYRTLADKPHRAIAGLSMGGGQTWRISMNFPSTFDYIGLYSAAIGWNGSNISAYDQLSPLIKAQFAQSPQLYWIAIGRDDFLYDNNAEFRNYLNTNKLPYTYFESAGGHTWSNWRLYLSRFLPMLFKNS